MKQLAFALITISCLGSSAFAQVSPAATGSATSFPGRDFQYAFRYAESAQFIAQSPTMQTSIVSGTLAYANHTVEKPFIMNYVGGYTWTLSGPDYQTGQFHRMFLSQGINFRRWQFFVQDNVAYMPQSPTTGFSGVAGIGEPIGVPNPAPSTNQAILTINTHVLNNSASGQVEHVLNYATTATIGGGSDLLYFPNGDGIDTRGLSANGQLTRRINARTSIRGRYIFTQFQYPGFVVEMHTHTALAGLERRITRNLTATVFVGPQWIDSNVSSIVPAQRLYATNAGVYYAKRFTSLGGTYVHGTNGGSGYLIGGTVDDFQGNFMRRMSPNVTLGLSGGYQRTAAFNSAGVTGGAYGASQVTWQVGRNLVVFGNYTGRGQSSTSQLPGNVLNQTIHTLSFGFGLSPRQDRLRP
jgi:hypothetical protein